MNNQADNKPFNHPRPSNPSTFMEYKENLLGVVETVFKWKKVVLGTCLATAVGSAIVSLLLPVYYKSTTTFYAASPTLAVPEIIFGLSTDAPQYYGNSNDLDRLISIANSGELATFMIDSFNLYDHYGIKRNSRMGPYTVRLKFAKHFEAVKTKYDAIELSVEDRDKELAAAMANAARERINFIGQKLIKDSQAKILSTYEDNIEQKEGQLKTINDSLQLVRMKFGVFSPVAQSEGLTELVAKAESKLNNEKAKMESLQALDFKGKKDTLVFLTASLKGYESELSKLRERLDTFNLGMTKAEILKSAQNQAAELLARDKERMKHIHAAYESNVPATLLLESATVPLVKARPKRALIVVAATVVAFIFSVLGVVVFDTYRDVDWKEVLHI